MKQRKQQIDLKDMIRNPTRYFDKPQQVLNHDRLDAENKVAILQQWKLDANLRETAEGENMRGNDDQLADELRDVSRALRIANKGLSAARAN